MLTHNHLVSILNDNVVELEFLKRTNGMHRRMLCTNSKKLLNSIAGKIALKYKPPIGVGLKYSPQKLNLVVTWDLFWQDFRQIPLESVNVLSAVPLKTDEEITMFWDYFNRKLQNLSPVEKLIYMRR